VAISYLFPGQGSQSVGMGKDLYESYPAAKEVFDRADEALNTRLSKLCFEGPEEELKQTVNAQPAILVVSLAYLKAYESLGLTLGNDRPLYTAGHSLGEYTALVASNAIDLETAVRLVRERGRLMQQASLAQPGGMAAILGLTEYVCEEVCIQTGAQIANINSQEQIVISGSKEALVRAMDLAKARGAKRAIPLEVSGAFHSELMRSASDGLASAIASLPLRDPEFPIVANCTAKPMKAEQDLKLELAHQLCRCVRWHDSIEYMVDAGVSTFIELGPGRVLSGLLKRLDRTVEAINAAEALKGGY